MGKITTTFQKTVRRPAAIAAAILAGTFLAGCTSRIVVSEPQAAAPSAGLGEPGGLVYSLPKTIVTVEATQDAGGKISYKITPAIVPDASARYRMRFTSTGLTDDDIKLAVDDNGLLTTTTAAVTDQSAEVIVALAKTAATLAGSPFASGALPPKQKKQTAAAYPFTQVLTLEEMARGTPLYDGRVIRADLGVDIAAPPAVCAFSLCYRTSILVRGSIHDGSANVGSDFTFIGVDPSHTEGIDLRVAGLVKRTNTVSIKSGIAFGDGIQQDSTVLAAANLPLKVVKAILSAPQDLLTIRVQNLTQQGSLIQQQTAVLNDQVALLNARKALQAAQAAPAAPAQ